MATRACRSNNTWRHPSDATRPYDGSQCITESTFRLRMLSQVGLRKLFSDHMCIILLLWLTAIHPFILSPYIPLQQMVTAENFEMVGMVVVSIVSGLDEEDEQSTDNLNIIANVYDGITNLVESGNITVTETVRIAMRLVAKF